MDDYARVERKPGQVMSAIGGLNTAMAALDDRLIALAERLAPVRLSVPRPSADDNMAQDKPMRAPVAEEIEAMTAKAQRLEARISDLMTELEV